MLVSFYEKHKESGEPSIETTRRRFGKASNEVRSSERIKMMFMMLPLVPETLVNREIVDDDLQLWEAEFPGTVVVFDRFRDYLSKMYVGSMATYKPHIRSVSGMRIRTNNAAESLHGRLNRTLRRDGKISCDQFLLAIQTQMANATREIRRGCEKRTKAVYQRRNDLLAVELDELLNGRIGLFAFLEHCSEILF